ncbi:MAG: hypothetical protein AB1831_03190 [Pseudomonadota bacterium]
MKFANTVKKLGIVGLSVLGLSAGVSQADFGYNHGYQNPWMPNQHVNAAEAQRQHLEQFDQRMDNQLQRILKGMEHGKLTMREAVHLLREHQAINALERQFLADGRLGPRELFDLDRRLDQASRQIRFEKTDPERVGADNRWDRGY